MERHELAPNQAQEANLILAFGSLGLLTSVALFVYFVNPLTTRIIPPCPFLWLTGLDCPGCGATRAMHSLVHGELGAAFSYNMLLMLALPALAYMYLSFLSGEFLGRPLPTPDRLRGYTWLVPIVVVGFMVVRNLPWEPFTYFAA